MNSADNTSTEPCEIIAHSWQVRGAAGVSCLLLTAILLAELLCDHHAYKTTLQRLILYYTLLSFVYQTLNSVNAIAQNHSTTSQNNITELERAAMYFANTAFFLPAIIINYLMYMIMRLCCGLRIRYPPSKLYTFVTEFACTMLGLVLSLIWVIFNITWETHFSFDTFYTVHATEESTKKLCALESESSSEWQLIIAQVVVSAVIISEMVVAVLILNMAHCKIRLHVKGEQILAFERKTHIIVTAVALVYVVGLPLSLGLIYVKQNNVIIFFALWFPLLNQCNLVVLYVASIRTTNNPLFCLQRKRRGHSQQTVNTDLHHTNPTSHPLVQPSHTTFSLPYTGAFTSITDTSGVYCDSTATYYRSGCEEESSLLVKSSCV